MGWLWWPFSIDNGLLTQTLKQRRDRISSRDAAAIAAIYGLLTPAVVADSLATSLSMADALTIKRNITVQAVVTPTWKQEAERELSRASPPPISSWPSWSKKASR